MRTPLSPVVVGCVAIGSVILSSFVGAAEPPVQRADADPLTVLNQEFRATYARARADLLRQTEPVLLFDGEKLVLLRGAERREGTPLPAVYDRLKTVSHLPFAVYLELRSQTTKPLDEAARGRVERLHTLAAAVERQLPQLDVAPGEPERQQRLVAASLKLLAGVLAQNQISAAELDAFAKQTAADLDANLTAAADVELGHYDRQLREWNLTPDDWRQLRVVVMGSAMPRREHRVVQLLAALLGVPGEGKRIVYAEALYEEQRALNLLGTHLLDAESAAAFFGDPTRLDRDLLADGAARYIREHGIRGQAEPTR